MQIVYVLKSQKDGNLYIGCTSNLENRVKQHNGGFVRSTKSRTPLELVYWEEYNNKFEAFRRERFYKTPKGKKEINNKIKHCGIV
jgi:putative endonuclease